MSAEPKGRPGWARSPVLVSALTLAVLGAVVLASWRLFATVRSKEPPSIVLIMTDDQRWDTLSAMPIVRRRLAARGVTFTNSFVVNPLCCPSRASTLTGRYPHSTGVWHNTPPYGLERFRDRSTVATWLDAAGYQTALFGKYLNRYEDTRYIPPGWRRWVAFDGSAVRGHFYYDYRLNIDGRIRRFGTDPEDYSTDVLANRAVSYIRGTEGPLLLYFAPANPHVPSTPGPLDTRSYADLPPWRPPSYNERDVSDKPRWVKSLPRLGPDRRSRADRLRRSMLASLEDVDRAVGRIVTALEATGRIDNTLIVFTSDNGYSWGEHRWVGKVAPWQENIRVPMVIRYDPAVPAPRRDPRLVLNVDLAATFADVAGTEAPGAVGRSLMPLLVGDRASWRRDFSVESMKMLRGGGVPTYCGLRTARYYFVAYATGDLELYDLRADPYELDNLAPDPGRAGQISAFESRLRRLCNPPPPRSPPGFPP